MQVAKVGPDQQARAQLRRRRETKRILLIVACTVILPAVVAGAMLLLHGGHPNSGPAVLVDETTGSNRCVRTTVTTCSITITNTATSRDSLQWKVKETTPADASLSPTEGTLQPGQTAQIQMVFLASRPCPYTATFSQIRVGASPQGDFRLTWNCL